jgi:hypothetical protein
MGWPTSIGISGRLGAESADHCLSILIFHIIVDEYRINPANTDATLRYPAFFDILIHSIYNNLYVIAFDDHVLHKHPQ